MRHATFFRCLVGLIALASIILFGSQGYAQSRPKITDTGLIQPKTIMYVGNSFFYYNNSMHSQVSAIAYT